jgi:hypothetical protein
MGTTGITEGHEKTGTNATWQADGLRDSDVLSSATLTNFVERGIGNGVIPIGLTNYSTDSGGTDRNNPIVGNCVVRPNTGGATNSIFVDAGVVCLDGVFYNVGSAGAFNFDTSGYYNNRFNAGGMVLPSGSNQECWVLVIVDPELNGTNNVGLVCGPVVDVSTGLYPQMPYSHLIKQSVVLAALRVTFASPLNVAAIEDKRMFIRGGPMPLTTLKKANGEPTDPLNDYGTTPSLTAGTLPEAGLGAFYARNPLGHNPALGAIHGIGQTHLFYQSDAALGAAAGGSYQITPVHRTEKQILSVGAGAGALAALACTPLASATGAANTHLITIMWTNANGSTTKAWVQNVHYTVSGKIVTTTAAGAAAGSAEITYVHSGY